MSHCTKLVLLGLVVLTHAGSARGDFVNGSFETGNFTGWSTTGNTAVVGNLGTGSTGVPVPAGNFQALLSTQLSGTTAAGLETFLGLPAGRLLQLSGSPFGVFNGSAIRQSVTVAAGDTLTFQWDFLTNEPTTLFNDFSFVSIVGGALNQSAVLGSVLNSTLTATSAPGFARQGGYRMFSFTFPQAGTFTVGVGVLNVGDINNQSGLVVDNFQVGGGTGGGVGGIPEPATIAVFGLGTLGMAVWGRRRRTAA